MAIPTTRAAEAANVTIRAAACTGCGLCVSVCKDFGLRLDNGKARQADSPLYGCIGCGHCMAVCPSGAIAVRGRTLTPEDLFPLPGRSAAASYEQFLALLRRRRSIREFLDTPVEPRITEKILNAARTAPAGLPPSDVNVLVLDSRQKNRAFARDFCDYLKGMRWLVSPWFLALMRPFWGKTRDMLFRNFIRPTLAAFIGRMGEGVNIVTYDAPLAMYFYTTPHADPADPLIAATYAMLAAESLGLGTCMIGSIHPMIQNGRKARLFRQRHGIRYASREGLFVLFGYPSVAYGKGIERTFASVTYA